MRMCTWHCCQTRPAADSLLCAVHIKADALIVKPPRAATPPTFVDERLSLPFRTMWWLPHGGY